MGHWVEFRDHQQLPRRRLRRFSALGFESQPSVMEYGAGHLFPPLPWIPAEIVTMADTVVQGPMVVWQWADGWNFEITNNKIVPVKREPGVNSSARPDVVRGRECCGPGDLFKRIVCIVQFKHVQQGFRQSGKTTCRGHEL